MVLDATANGRAPLEVPVLDAARGRCKPLALEPTWAEVDGRRMNPAGGPESQVAVPPDRMPDDAAGTFEPTGADLDRRRVNPAGSPEPQVVVPPDRMPDDAAGTFEPTGADVDRRRVNPAGGPELHIVMSPRTMPNASVGLPRHVTPAVAVVVPHPMPRGDHDRPRRMPRHKRHPMAAVSIAGAEAASTPVPRDATGCRHAPKNSPPSGQKGATHRDGAWSGAMPVTLPRQTDPGQPGEIPPGTGAAKERVPACPGYAWVIPPRRAGLIRKDHAARSRVKRAHRFPAPGRGAAHASGAPAAGLGVD